ncbi:MAG TPA: DMT family transporter, partial [Candidatus Limnocylindrales bacterium]
MTSGRAAIALVRAAASWGFGTVIAKRAVGELAPISLLAIQLAASVVVTATVLRLRGIPWRDPSAPIALLRLGLLNPGLAYALSLIGLVSISASLSVLLWALEPLLILVLAAALLGERVGPLVLALSAIAIAGLVAVAEAAFAGAPLGVILTVAGVVACALYTIGTRRWIHASDGTAQVVLGQQVHGLAFALFAVAAVVLTGGSLGLERLTVAGLASAIGSGLLYYAAAYWFYLSALRRVPASVASACFYLVPVFGVAGGFAFLGDRLSVAQWVGAAVAALAVATILARTLRQVPASATIAPGS